MRLHRDTMPSSEEVEVPRRCSTSSESSDGTNSEGINIFEDMNSVRLSSESDGGYIEDLLGGENKENNPDGENSSGFGSENDNKTEDEVQSLSPEQQTKLVRLLEYYMSDVNLEKDPFLLKHVVRNKEGLVSLKLLASFRKIRSITRDWKVVLYCIKNVQNELVLNDEETKVRRKVNYSGPTDILKKKHNSKSESKVPAKPATTEKVKKESECKPEPENEKWARCVLASNLAPNANTIASIAQLFSQCGSVVSVRIIKSEEDLQEFKPYLSKSIQSSSNCALVEYSTFQEANSAVAKLAGKNNDWRSMQVCLVTKCKKDSQPNQGPKPEQSKPEKRINRTKLVSESSSRPMEIDEGKPASLSAYRRKHPMPSDANNRRGISLSYEDRSEFLNPTSWRQKSISVCEPSEQSPWVQRRLQAAKESGQSRSLPTVKRAEGIPDGVIRLPKGPDGTRGFHNTKSESSLLIRV